ncbi:hypothetical protein RRG08_056690 [Elysia crispata]|uniref:Uncharacterized protein n=1 Tax=Elysia crispata TaxID=231223 RepID=A0AAE1CLH3_9GAST|nr:hypothetical protein RRG08_056690 [Elysia crispata]
MVTNNDFVVQCPSGSYGEECAATCSDHCAGDQNPCHHVNGTCDLGCDPGYQGSSCTQEYPVVDGLSEVTLKSSRHKNKWSSFFHSLSCGETFM